MDNGSNNKNLRTMGWYQHSFAQRFCI